VTIENEDSDDDLLVPRGKTKDEADLEEEEYREFLEREVGQDLKELITLDEPSSARRPTVEDGDGDEAVANGEETKEERKARKKGKKRREKEKEQKGKEAASQGSQKQNKEDQDREFLMKLVSLCLGHD
jgi:protein KRI1